MYFKQFPTIPYDSTGTGQTKDVKNLLRRVAIRQKVKSNTLFYDTYDVKDGDSPESIADKLYDNPELHWVVLLVNDITDVYHQWPLRYSQFLQFVKDKYPNPNGVHHYEIPQSSGDTTKTIEVYANAAIHDNDVSYYPNATIITNIQYEENRQDELRKIRLLDPRFITQFVEEFENIMKETII